MKCYVDQYCEGKGNKYVSVFEKSLKAKLCNRISGILNNFRNKVLSNFI